jgi:signal transduction histidine kinase
MTRTELAVPEVMLLLGTDGKILRSAAVHTGQRLGDLAFRAGATLHDALHPGCEGTDCELLATWQEAWQRRRTGLAVEFEAVLHSRDTALRVRVQPVSYAWRTLFDSAIEQYEQCSLVFVQDITRSFALWEDLYDIVQASRRPRLKSTAHTSISSHAPGVDGDLATEVGSLVLRVLRSQKSERRRIRAELHDGLGQTLSLLRFETDGLREEEADRPGASDANSGSLQRVCEYVRRAQMELRQVTQHLKPALLVERGLSRALETLCADIGLACPDVKIELALSHGTDELPDDMSVTIFRVAQEALTNMARHSRAAKVGVEVNINDDCVKLTVSDDGVGMPDSVQPGPGLGLRTMRERTESIGGKFVFASRPGGGCVISASWSPQRDSFTG